MFGFFVKKNGEKCCKKYNETGVDFGFVFAVYAKKTEQKINSTTIKPNRFTGVIREEKKPNIISFIYGAVRFLFGLTGAICRFLIVIKAVYAFTVVMILA